MKACLIKRVFDECKKYPHKRTNEIAFSLSVRVKEVERCVEELRQLGILKDGIPPPPQPGFPCSVPDFFAAPRTAEDNIRTESAIGSGLVCYSIDNRIKPQFP